MSIELAGHGEHLWLQVRKRGHNTEQVARMLARAAGVAPRQVGYAGMKDRRAIAVQWFSLHLPGRADPDWTGLPAGIEIVRAVRHTRKLQRGALRGNRFTIVLRQCTGEESALRARCAEIARDGVPNYFGEQRFGRDGMNVVNARALFAGARMERETANATDLMPGRTSAASRASDSSRGPRLHPVGDRHRRGIYLSSARAFLFNAVLAARIERDNWQTPLPGEACVLAGSHSFFIADAADDVILRRLAEQDIHLSGPMWGAGELPTRAAVRELELAVIDGHADLAPGLASEGLRQERRALRLIPRQLECERLDADDWRLSFSLPAGAFATALLRELADYDVADAAFPGDDEA